LRKKKKGIGGKSFSALPEVVIQRATRLQLDFVKRQQGKEGGAKDKEARKVNNPWKKKKRLAVKKGKKGGVSIVRKNRLVMRGEIERQDF